MRKRLEELGWRVQPYPYNAVVSAVGCFNHDDLNPAKLSRQ
jgi:hypothetical protein